MTDLRLAILLVLAQHTFYAIETLGIRQLAGVASVTQIGLLRGLFLLAVITCLSLIAWRRHGDQVWRTAHPWILAVRSVTTVAYSYVMIWALGVMPLTEATALNYLTPVYTGLLSVLLLGERVGAARGAAIALGFGGALLLAKPSNLWAPAGLYVFGIYMAVALGTVLNSLSVVLTRYLLRVVGDRQGDSETTVLLWVAVGQVVGFAPSLGEDWHHLTPAAWPWVAMVGMWAIGILCGTMAYKRADASLLAPYTYVRLLLLVVAGILLFGEWPDLWSGAGCGLIVAACGIVHRDASARRRAAVIPLAARGSAG